MKFKLPVSRYLPFIPAAVVLVAVGCSDQSVGFVPPTITPTVPVTSTLSPAATADIGEPSATPRPVATAAISLPSATPRVTSTAGAATSTVSPAQSPSPVPTPASTPVSTSTPMSAPTQVPTPVPTASGPPSDLVVTNALVLTGRGEQIQNGTVAMREGVIVYVGPASGYGIPSGVKVIDANGGSALPGFINAHVHGTEDTGYRLGFLESGVTGTCNTAHSRGSMGAFRNPYGASGPGPGRAFNGGPFLGAQGNGYPASVFGSHLLFGVSGAASARAAVNELVDGGADFIKISLEPDFDGSGGPPFPLLTQAELEAIVNQAHLRGVIVKAHVTDGDQITRALEAGVDSFEHIPEFPSVNLSVTADVPFGDLFSNVNIAGVAGMKAVIDQMVSAGVTLVPTIAVMNREVPWTRATPTGTVSVYQEVVEYFVRSGGKLALGTDAPLGEAGMPLGEIQLMLESGLNGAGLIVAATYNAAVACGQQERIGSLEVGKLADIIVVNGNPMLDITVLSEVTTVILDGEVVA